MDRGFKARMGERKEDREQLLSELEDLRLQLAEFQAVKRSGGDRRCESSGPSNARD
jgi:hypothetical protein